MKIRKIIALNINFLLNSANITLLLSTISVGDEKTENETKLVASAIRIWLLGIISRERGGGWPWTWNGTETCDHQLELIRIIWCVCWVLVFLCLLFMINTKKNIFTCYLTMILQYSNYFEKISLSYALKSKNRFLYIKN